MKKMSKNKIIVAVDKTDLKEAKNLISQVKDSVGVIKLGLEFFVANGPNAVKEIAKNQDVFLDLKLHDIPNTVAKATQNAASLNVRMITIHTLGGFLMMKAAADSIKKIKNRPLILGVTVLTSMENKDLKDIGIKNKTEKQVVKLASLAKKAGLDGVICSPHEIKILRKELGKNFKLVVPGIRPSGSGKGDQKRVMTPKEAIKKGADYIVIGRPITESSNPKKSAKEIIESI